jgi:hypothetical protein
MAGAIMAGLFVPRPAAAHTPGLSTAAFDVQPDGRVEARLVFATAEPLRGTPLKDDDLRAFVLDGIEVDADGSACSATFRGAGVTEVDGLVLEASYACARGSSEIAVTLYYLSALAPAHREVARITAGSATNEAVLSGDRRAIALRLPADTLRVEREHQRRARLLTMMTATFALFMASLFVWRWRATRKA